ncbi:hypothetical protein SAMN04489720_1730 [Agrococcus jejuensis]|uniref:Asp23 family, cell envelope-related function n=2 Tax=Agrococcus jejuensis TaxID=399736 RepID=A0A1G8DQE9_9MICO|nr:hypothetical protein SAMN04489720_1730 [Agrococcus jejuensis]
MHEDPTPRDDARAAPDGPDDASSATTEATTDDVVAQVEAEVAAQDAVEARAAEHDELVAAVTPDETTEVDAVSVEVDADAVSDGETDADESEAPETIGGTGHTLEELSAYFDRGRTPRIAALEHDAEARALLDSMERLDRLSTTMANEDAAAAGDLDEQWLDGLLGVIRSEVRAGRDLPIEDPDERTSTTITEGALREIARTAGDGVDGVLVGRVHLREADGVLDVRISIGVRFGNALVPTAEAVRLAVHHALLTHAPMAVGTIDVVVDDVLMGATR